MQVVRIVQMRMVGNGRRDRLLCFCRVVQSEVGLGLG